MMYGIGGLVEGRIMAKTEIPIIMAADSTYLPYAAVSIIRHAKARFGVTTEPRLHFR